MSSDEEGIEPWYDSGLGRAVVGGVILAALGWSASMLMAAADANALARKNAAKVEEVADGQRSIETKLLPAVEGVEREVKHLRHDINKLEKKIEEAQP